MTTERTPVRGEKIRGKRSGSLVHRASGIVGPSGVGGMCKAEIARLARGTLGQECKRCEQLWAAELEATTRRG